jgi:hypothetical protein
MDQVGISSAATHTAKAGADHCDRLFGQVLQITALALLIAGFSAPCTAQVENLPTEAWLKSHGVAAARITAKGFGKTKPVAGNNADAGQRAMPGQPWNIIAAGVLLQLTSSLLMPNRQCAH